MSSAGVYGARYWWNVILPLRISVIGFSEKLSSVLFIILIIISSVIGDQIDKKGVIRGTVLCKNSLQGLAGANIVVKGEKSGAGSDIDGNFVIHQLPYGIYTLEVSYQGYETRLIPDIIVRSSRETNVTILLTEAYEQINAVIVTSGYFERKTNETNNTEISFSNEEIRRSAGSGGDISRSISGLPSVARVNDSKNSLIVRGGSPLENTFYIENIEVNNINHFPAQGSSEGAISMLNIDLVDNMTFSAGGFSAKYGDKLSSVMDITLRDPSKGLKGQFDLSMMGFGGLLEGSLPVMDGGFIVGARRSYLDLISEIVNVGQSSLPNWTDAHFQLVIKNGQGTRLHFSTFSAMMTRV